MELKALLSKLNAQIKYTVRHVIILINIPAGTGQAGKAPGSRLANLSSSHDRRKFLLYNYYYKNIKHFYIFSENVKR